MADALFERQHHLLVAEILRALDGDRLRRARCYFGGGTAIALLKGEYRESVDIDLLVSDLAGYRTLRADVRRDGLPAIFSETVRSSQEPRTDRYGIRARILAGTTEIKLEIIHEARIELDDDGEAICGIQTLAPVDLLATKMLANSDRGLDAFTCYRDIIDLAMLEAEPDLVARGFSKAGAAYGEETVRSDLERTFEHLEADPRRLDACMERMRVTVPKVLLWEKLEALMARLPPPAPEAPPRG